MAPAIRFANPLVVAQDHMRGSVNLLSRTHLGSLVVVAPFRVADRFLEEVLSPAVVQVVVPVAVPVAFQLVDRVVCQAVLRSPLPAIQAGEVIPAIGI